MDELLSGMIEACNVPLLHKYAQPLTVSVLHVCLCVCSLLQRADQADVDELSAGMIEARNVPLSHKYAQPLNVDITIQFAGEKTGCNFAWET